MNIDLMYTFAYCFEVDMRIQTNDIQTNEEKNKTKIPHNILSLDLEKMFMLGMTIDSKLIILCCTKFNV